MTYLPVELTDYGQVLDAMLGVEERYSQVDALVHLAAIPAPGRVPDHATFAHNLNATWNVVSAARRAGITNIVWASSETVLGLPFETPPPYAPVDEEYPPRPESTYSLVKTLEEAMAAQLCRWDPELKMIGLRFSNVMRPADYAAFPSFQDDAVKRKWNLWGYIDARDGAQAVRLALESDLTGCEIFIIANADTVMDRTERRAARRMLPRRRGPWPARSARHPAVHRQGAAGPRLRAAAQLARPVPAQISLVITERRPMMTNWPTAPARIGAHGCAPRSVGAALSGPRACGPGRARCAPLRGRRTAVGPGRGAPGSAGSR